MGRVGVSRHPLLRLAVVLVVLGCALMVAGVYMAAGPWWACTVVGFLVAVFAAVVLDVGERPARSGR